MKTIYDIYWECLSAFKFELTCPEYTAFRCWGCIHKTACILTATVACDMILEGKY